jgi:hypothetical protein
METRSGGGRYRLIPACRNVFLLASIGSLLLSLSVAPGCCKRHFGTREKAAPANDRAESGNVGVAVTKEVPHSKETLSEIRDRERSNPLPARWDTEIRSHKIPRAGNDNCGRTE